MPLRVSDFSAIRRYIDSYPGVVIFYSRDGNYFKIVAGKLFWEGDIPDPDNVEVWLRNNNAYRVESWKCLEEIFHG